MQNVFEPDESSENIPEHSTNEGLIAVRTEKRLGRIEISFQKSFHVFRTMP